MREIKYRVYDTKGRKMLSFDVLQRFALLGLVFTKEEQYKTMQYTNQKNYKGQDIYEGDYVLVKVDDGFNYGDFVGVVRFLEGSWVVDNYNEELIDLFSETNEIDILGNIYENPELLNG